MEGFVDRVKHFNELIKINTWKVFIGFSDNLFIGSVPVTIAV